MKKVSWRGWIVTFLTKILFWKYACNYKDLHGQELPAVIVSGTVGKSSQTAILAQIFATAGWTVVTGAGQSQSLNSITGLGMILAGIDLQFTGVAKYTAGLQFVLRMLYAIIAQRWKMPGNTIVIYEAGIDSANEAALFDTVLAVIRPILIVTSVTAEHTGGFEQVFDPIEIVRMAGRVPVEFLQIFTDTHATDAEKNVALGQAKIHTNPSAVILPTSLARIDNQYVETLSSPSEVHTVAVQRSDNFALLIDNKYTTHPHYLLPQTFAKTVSVATRVASHFGINQQDIQQGIMATDLPRGRFGLFAGIDNSTIVDSTYNADPASMNSFFDLLEEVIQSYQRAFERYQQAEEDKHLYRPGSHLRKNLQPVVPPKHNVILGEMRELGSQSAQYHRQVIARLLTITRTYPDSIENVYLVGQEWKKIDEDGIPKSDQGMYFIRQEKQLLKGFESVKYLTPLLDKKSIRPSSWWWIKGSQNTIYLESVVAHLLDDKKDTAYLCRQGKNWDTLRAPYV